MFSRILVIVLVGIGVIGGAYLLRAPVPIDPAAWTPPRAPNLTGAYRPNERLAAIERLGSGMGTGPEDVDVDGQGRIYAGLEDGRIIRVASDGTGGEAFARTGGRPLGLAFDGAANLIVADADRGLLSVTPDGEVEVLATAHDGLALAFTDDVDVGPDGTIYFSDASWKFGVRDYKHDLMEHRPNGRLLAYDPATKETRLLLDSLYFANGVAVSGDGTFVLVVETAKYRVTRYWLAGEHAGSSDVFIENLPGFPDGISEDGNGGFWLPLVSPRDAQLDRTLLPRPFLRKVLVRLPEAVLPKPRNYGFVIHLDGDGSVVDVLQDPEGRFAQITSVEQVGGHLYFGSLAEDAIGRMTVP